MCQHGRHVRRGSIEHAKLADAVGGVVALVGRKGNSPDAVWRGRGGIVRFRERTIARQLSAKQGIRSRGRGASRSNSDCGDSLRAHVGRLRGHDVLQNPTAARGNHGVFGVARRIP